MFHYNVHSQKHEKKNLKSKMMTNKEKAEAINKAVQRADLQAAASLVTDDYIQHTPVVPNGKEGLLVLLNKIKSKEIPAPVIKNIRAFEDGNFVVLHHEIHWPNRKAMFEIFRFEDGLAAEHWSGVADHPQTTVNGHSMLDGETEIKDHGKTEANKSRVKAFLQNVFIDGHFDQMQNYLDPQLIQHNPDLDNTVEGLIRGVQEMQQKGIQVQFEKIHFVLGEGNFVLTLSEGKFGGKHTAFYDLFRVENEKIVEHWDVLQEVPEKMAHENGMFKVSLYKRLGGYDAIAAFVDLAFPRVAVHPDLAHFFIGHSSESKYRQRQLIVDKLCHTLQGPVVYIGRPLESVHQGLNITPEQWDTFMKIIIHAMDERGITGEEKHDFVTVFENIFRPVTVEEELTK
jgi:predicted SnoaL-like aldol condensation-catalyzing enzyme